MEPLLAGGTLSSVTHDDDAMYVHDLGLIALEPEVHIANPIYREVIVRVLAARIEGDIRVTPRHFLGPDDGQFAPAPVHIRNAHEAVDLPPERDGSRNVL